MVYESSYLSSAICAYLQGAIIGERITIEEQTLGADQPQADIAPTIARSTAIMSVATLLSRITGFARMWATALALGAGAIASGYNVANNVPNMIFELVAGGILSSLFIPTFMEVREQRSEKDAWRFVSHILNICLLALGTVAVVGTIFPDPFIWTQTFKMPVETAASVREPAGFLFRFFAIQVFVYGGGMIIQGILNAQRRYLWTALGPVFNNLIVIATMLYVASRPALDTTTLIVLACGTTLGVFVMFAVMLPSLKKTGIRYHFELGLDDPAIRKMLRLALPTLVYVITNLVTVSFRNASALAATPSGTSVLSYAWTWYQLPYGILAVALATATFTELSNYASKNDMVGFKITLSKGLRSTALLMMPAAAMLFALATPLSSLFVAGRFEQSDVAMVAGALRYWSVALTFFALMMFILRAFYSLKDTKTPAWCNIGTSAVQVGGYLVLTTGIGAWSGFGINGIPLADALFCLLQFSALLVLMQRKIGPFDIKSFLSTALRMAVASALAALVASAVSTAIGNRVDGITGSLTQVFAAGSIGLIVAFALAYLGGVREMSIITDLVKGRIKKRTGRL